MRDRAQIRAQTYYCTRLYTSNPSEKDHDHTMRFNEGDRLFVRSRRTPD